MRQMSCRAECEKKRHSLQKSSRAFKGHLADSAAALLDFKKQDEPVLLFGAYSGLCE